MEHVEIQREHEDNGNNDYKKDWFAPAVASMARLNQIQANVYDMGFHSVSSLKVSLNVRPKTRLPPKIAEHSPQWVIDSKTAITDANSTTERENKQVKYTDLQPTPPLSTVSYQRTAWGSNQSIPELIAQHGKKIIKQRPSSAKVPTSTRLRQTSQNRPHSAKEPLCHDKDQNKVQTFGVCGQKKSVLTNKPPSRSNTPSQGAKHRKKKSNRCRGAWAGPPAGHEMQPVHQSSGQNEEESHESPRVPPSSPVPDDSWSDMDDGPQTPPLLRRPLPEPIHLSLPSVNDSTEIVRGDGADNKDDMDTERLLKQAVCFVNQQKIKKVDVVSGNTTLPEDNNEGKGVTCHDNEAKQNSSQNNAVDKYDTSYTGAHETKFEKFSPREKTPSFQKLKQETFLSSEMESASCPPWSVKEESSRMSMKKSMGNLAKKANSLAAQASVKIREDKNITVDITPRNIGRKVGDTAPITGEEYRSRINSSKRRQDGEHSSVTNDKSLVSMMNLEYQVIVDDDSCHKKLNSRKKKAMVEVETIVSQLSRLSSYDDEETPYKEDILMSQVLHKSEGEKNYFELSRSQSRQSNLSDGSSKEENVFYKTTKTLEFNQDALQETSCKTAIKSCAVNKQKPPVQHKPPRPLSAVKTSQNMKDNPRKSLEEKTENLLTAVESVDDAQTDVEKLADILQEAKAMAESSLYNAKKSRPSSGKKTGTQKPKISNNIGDNSRCRPFSAGSKLNGVSDDVTKGKVGSSMTSNRLAMFSRKTRPSGCRHTDKSAKHTAKPLIINSLKQTPPVKSAESCHCRQMQSRMEQLGVDVDPLVLERALFAPIGEPLYYEVPGGLPKDLSAGLLSHYKYWLSEDYKRVQLMEKRLAQDDHIKYLQKLAAEKRAKKAAAKESKGKDKKKKKLQRSNSVL